MDFFSDDRSIYFPLQGRVSTPAGAPLEVTIRVDDSGVREFATQFASRIGDQVEYLPEVKP